LAGNLFGFQEHDLPALILPLASKLLPADNVIHLLLSDFFRSWIVTNSLSCGINPNQILPKLLQIQTVEPGVVHIFTAVMGLYLATIVLWLLGPIRGGPLMRTALNGEIVFMAGLARC
jgi:hypothetical protein